MEVQRLRLFIPIFLLALPRTLIPANLIDATTIRNTGRMHPGGRTMTAIPRALERIFLHTTFGAGFCAGPAQAQKSGGSVTVGIELDSPGFDPLKVGVFDTAALRSASALF